MLDASPSLDAAADASGEAGRLPDGPLLLSETGLYADIARRTLDDGVAPYAVQHDLWSDGATKTRWLRLPAEEPIDTNDADRWIYPVGTRAWKEFAVGGRAIETRLLEKTAPNAWRAVSYAWREDGSDADAVPGGLPDAASTEHDIPSAEDCVRCHMGDGREWMLGVTAVQLTAESVARLAGASAFTTPPPGAHAVPGTGDTSAALAYLHANCGHCHADDYFLADKFSVRFRLRVGDLWPEATSAYTTGIDAPTRHDVGGTTRVISPGSPAQSQAWVRMGVRDYNAMPPLGTERVDDVGRDVIRRWIEGLGR